jgi:predicted nucleic acid-binding protein
MSSTIIGVVDTTVLIHLLRNNAVAIAWVKIQPTLSITSISWMEVIYGANGRSGQTRSLNLFKQFDLALLTQEDQQWAMQRLLVLRLSRGVSITDCLIASVCHRLQVPLYTHNIKDMIQILNPSLVIKPY